jgi:putative ABC transport system substrate-binding protein
MRRRDFITLLGGAAAAWPLAAGAQQGERVRRVGVLSSLPEHDPESAARRAVFEQELTGLGWTVGRNLQIDYRWTASEPAVLQKSAAQLAALPMWPSTPPERSARPNDRSVFCVCYKPA